MRAQPNTLIAIGAYAMSDSIQAQRTFADVAVIMRAVFADPEYTHTLASSTGIADRVSLDFELRGCPISKTQLPELIAATLAGCRRHVPHHSRCVEYKRHGTFCVMVARGELCLGPVTQAGCGSLGRPCYGCFGPMESANIAALARVQGEGALYVRINWQEVESVECPIFEALLAGRLGAEAPEITARICGICPVA